MPSFRIFVIETDDPISKKDFQMIHRYIRNRLEPKQTERFIIRSVGC